MEGYSPLHSFKTDTMKKILTLFAVLTMIFSSAYGQKKQKVDTGNGHKIVFQFTNGQDTIQQKAFVNQLNNLTAHWPEATFYVVLYNQGLELVMPDKSKFLPQVKTLTEKGVQFVVCENSMKARKITKDRFEPIVGYVPAGIAEIVLKQEKGWSYIKGGF